MKNVNLEIAAKSLFNTLSERSVDVLSKRFGLFGDSKTTLDAIGKKYGITRERVRQIEEAAIANAKLKLAENQKCLAVLDALNKELNDCGQLAKKEDFLAKTAQNNSEKQNYIIFFLTLGDAFKFLKENENFFERWTVADSEKLKAIEAALFNLNKKLLIEHTFSESEIVENFKNCLAQSVVACANAEANHLRFWIRSSKKISSNALGEWGLAESPFIRPKGIKDYAYLVMRKHGSPMHFTEVAKAITSNLNKPAHTQTVHNELIKDDRFILVGRGLYSLKEWGYIAGTVRDVVAKILKDNGPLSKKEIMKRVLKERHVQESTVSINLQNKNFFKKLENERYYVV